MYIGRHPKMLIVSVELRMYKKYSNHNTVKIKEVNAEDLQKFTDITKSISFRRINTVDDVT